VVTGSIEATPGEAAAAEEEMVKEPIVFTVVVGRRVVVGLDTTFEVFGGVDTMTYPTISGCGCGFVVGALVGLVPELIGLAEIVDLAVRPTRTVLDGIFSGCFVSCFFEVNVDGVAADFATGVAFADCDEAGDAAEARDATTINPMTPAPFRSALYDLIATGHIWGNGLRETDAPFRNRDRRQDNIRPANARRQTLKFRGMGSHPKPQTPTNPTARGGPSKGSDCETGRGLPGDFSQLGVRSQRSGRNSGLSKRP
jgi:hypothetical protein